MRIVLFTVLLTMVFITATLVFSSVFPFILHLNTTGSSQWYFRMRMKTCTIWLTRKNSVCKIQGSGKNIISKPDIESCLQVFPILIKWYNFLVIRNQHWLERVLSQAIVQLSIIEALHAFPKSLNKKILIYIQNLDKIIFFKLLFTLE